MRSWYGSLIVIKMLYDHNSRDVSTLGSRGRMKGRIYQRRIAFGMKEITVLKSNKT